MEDKILKRIQAIYMAGIMGNFVIWYIVTSLMGR